MAIKIPADADVAVTVGSKADASAAKLAGSPSIILIPEWDERILGWNDFGYNLFAKLFIASGPDAFDTLDVLFMIEGVDPTTPELTRLLEQHGGAFPIEKIGRTFVALFVEDDAYGRLIKTLGFDVGISALRKLGDIVVARTEGENQATLKLADTESFHYGMLRAVGGYTALRRRARHFRRTSPSIVEDVAGKFSFETALRTAENPYRIEFDFGGDALFQDRVAVLIGRNGVGKTQLLKAFVERLIRDETFDPETAPSKLAPEVMPSRVLVFSAVPTDPFPRAIPAWQGIDYEYFAVNATRDEGQDSLLSSLMTCVRDDGIERFPRDLTRATLARAVLTKLGVWDTLHVPLRPLRPNEEGFNGTFVVGDKRYFRIKSRLAEQASLRLLHQLDWASSPIVLDEGGSPKALSSGEYAMMRFAVQAIASVENGSLLLIDEPETHLHPNFVSDLMEILYSVLEATGSIAIIATHSAYVVREVPRQRVKVLSLTDRQIFIDEPRMQTFGASIDKISQFAFGDTTMEHRYQRKLEEWADRVGKDLGIDRIIQEYGDELNPETLSFIAGYLRGGQPSK